MGIYIGCKRCLHVGNGLQYHGNEYMKRNGRLKKAACSFRRNDVGCKLAFCQLKTDNRVGRHLLDFSC